MTSKNTRKPKKSLAKVKVARLFDSSQALVD